MPVTTVDSPVGKIRLVSDGRALVSLTIAGECDEKTQTSHDDVAGERDDLVLEQCVRELAEYFKDTRTVFDVPVSYRGTPFQEQVWAALQDIPYGQTLSYGDVAVRINNPAAVRAVGRAIGANPVAIIIPCHRVLGSNRSLTGFSTGAGVDTKKLLLEREGIVEYQV